MFNKLELEYKELKEDLGYFNTKKDPSNKAIMNKLDTHFSSVNLFF